MPVMINIGLLGPNAGFLLTLRIVIEAPMISSPDKSYYGWPDKY